MRFTRSAAVFAATLFMVSISLAQSQSVLSSDRVAGLQEKMANVKNEAISKLPPHLQNAFSGGALNFLRVANAWNNSDQGFAANLKSRFQPGTMNAPSANAVTATPAYTGFHPIPVSAPSHDFVYSIEGGFTQSETSTAWCGNGVVVGFNDSGSVLETALGSGGLSFSGAGVSTDGGKSFQDIGPINPGANPFNFLEGDPVVNCTDASTFYYSQIGGSGTATAPTTVIFVSKSTDGGFTWNEPGIAVSKDAFTHSLDKDWSAIDPQNPNNIYVSYTDFEINSALCGANQRVAIEVVHSTDGGVTWSAPTVLEELCNTPPTFPFIQGSQIAVDSHGRVYVEWERFPGGFASDVREFRITRSTDRAITFEPSSTVSSVIATGDGFALQGYFRTWLTGNLAIDRSGTASDGTLYVAWEDGRLRSRPDLESPFGLYRYANVLITRSTNGGKTWSSPVRVNDDRLAPSGGVGVDHYQPGVAVDSMGAVGVCWYDRRVAEGNYLVSRFCGVSRRGTEWTDKRVDPTVWPPVHATDGFINPYYLGDYDGMAGDTTKGSAGFQGAYGNVTFTIPVPNQDVFLVHVRHPE